MKGNREDITNFFSSLSNAIYENCGKNVIVDVTILGGTYFVLNDLRENSPDVDFLVESDAGYKILSTVGVQTARKFNFDLDIMTDKTLHNIILPNNYQRKLRSYKRDRSSRPNLRVFTLSPYHILISKIARYSDKDKKDIFLMMNSGKFSIKKKILEKEIKNFNLNSIQNIFDKNYADFINSYKDKLKKSLFEW